MEYTLKLNLEKEDYNSLAQLAGMYGLDVSEVIEKFVNDLIGGKQTNGSDERMYAEQRFDRFWFDRCCIDRAGSCTLLAFLLENEELSTFFEEREAKKRNIKAKKEREESLQEIEEELNRPESNEWQEIFVEAETGNSKYHFSKEQLIQNEDGTYSCLLIPGLEQIKYIPAYKSKDGYLKDLLTMKADLENEVLEYEEALEDYMQSIRDDFDRYMRGKPYDWNKEVENVLSWCNRNVQHMD